jgi:hypothetical protein
MEVTTTLISSLLAVNIVDIAVRELRIRRDAKETIKAIEKISLSNDDCVSKVRFLDKEFGELTSLMLSNKLHYDQVSDEMTSRIDLMQVRLNKENMSLQSQIKETEQHWSLQIRTLDNELQSTIKRIDKIKKESQFRVVPASELFAQENLERQVQYLTERLDALTNKDEKSSKKQGSHFNRVPAEDLLNDATPIMDWANEKLHEDEPNKVEEQNEVSNEVSNEEPNEEPTPIPSESQTESELTEKERRQVALKEALDLIMDKYKISLPKAKVVLKWILEKAKEKDEQKIESKDEPHVEQQSKRRGRPRKETQQVVDELITTPTPTSKSKQRQPLFTSKEVHDEILRKLKIKWFTLRKKYGEAYYERQYKKAYKRLYYYKYEANSSPKETILTQTPTKENNTKNYESIF